MKRIIKVTLISCSLLASVSYFVSRAKHQPQMTGLILENVEALADGEGSGSIFCLGSGSVDCYGYNVEEKYIGLK